jgi:branched-chain amino acid transport system substrate-binding protein
LPLAVPLRGGCSATGGLMTFNRRAFVGGLLSLPLVAASRSSLAQATAEIPVGMTTALTGPSQALGLGMKLGVEAYFQQVNDEGGVFGRPLRLIALDDQYEPLQTGPNMRALIDQSSVFAVLGNVGTPTAAVAVSIANEKKVPFFGAFTGAGLLRKNPPDRFVVNYRASYAQETAEMVRGFLQELRIQPEHVAFFTQNDAYGDAGFAGGVKALKAAGYERAHKLPHGRYPRNTIDVEGALARLLDPNVTAKAVIMVGAYKPCAKFIRLARSNGLGAVFANVSFVGSDALARELGREGDGVVVTQVVPHYDESLPVVADYRRHVAQKDVGFVSLEGYIAARAFVEVLRAAGPNVNQSTFIDAVESGREFDLGLGRTHVMSPTNHQFSNAVWPTVLRGGHFYPLRRWSDLGARG